MKTQFPEGTKVLLLRKKDGWIVVPTFPNGYAIPQNALPNDLKFRRDLDAAYAAISEHHSDDVLSGGHDIGRDETNEPSDIPEGSVVVCEHVKNGWKRTVHYPEQGFSARPGNYRSLSDILKDLKLNYTVE